MRVLPIVMLVVLSFTETDAGAQARRAPAAAPALTVTVTDLSGAPLAGARVQATGAVTRAAIADERGVARLQAMQPGTYRLRLEHAGHVTLEQMVTVRTQAVSVSAALSPQAAQPREAPVARPGPPRPAPAARPEWTEPRSLSVPDFLERNFISSREPSRRSLVGCMAGGTTTVVQLREPLIDETHTDADASIYVIAGEGTIRVGDRDQPAAAGTLTIVPRGIAYTITRRGRNPIVVLTVLAGAPCQGN